jgi:hypothetical protein
MAGILGDGNALFVERLLIKSKRIVNDLRRMEIKSKKARPPSVVICRIASNGLEWV